MDKPNQVTPILERTSPAQASSTRRHVLLALPAVTAAGTILPQAVSATDLVKASSPGHGEVDSEHIRRFYKLARF